jgi:NAD(P)-dependent dehydrogenase (short-subunit alcohol dehydrogenase family)
VKQHWGGLDVLVNNAGIATGGRIDVATLEEWQRVLDVNLLGVVRGCRTFTPMFKAQRKGQIVNVASLAGLVHGPGMASYNAAKAGVVALSETLDYELAPWGVTTSVVCPAFFRTNLARSLAGEDAAMLAVAGRLIGKAETDADAIAGIVMTGIDARRRLILEGAARLARRD